MAETPASFNQNEWFLTCHFQGSRRPVRSSAFRRLGRAEPARTPEPRKRETANRPHAHLPRQAGLPVLHLRDKILPNKCFSPGAGLGRVVIVSKQIQYVKKKT